MGCEAVQPSFFHFDAMNRRLPGLPSNERSPCRSGDGGIYLHHWCLKQASMRKLHA